MLKGEWEPRCRRGASSSQRLILHPAGTGETESFSIKSFSITSQNTFCDSTLEVLLQFSVFFFSRDNKWQNQGNVKTQAEVWLAGSLKSYVPLHGLPRWEAQSCSLEPTGLVVHAAAYQGQSSSLGEKASVFTRAAMASVTLVPGASGMVSTCILDRVGDPRLPEWWMEWTFCPLIRLL